MTPEEIKKAISELATPENTLAFVPDKRLEKIPSPFTAGTHKVCPAYISKRTNGTKMLICMDDNGKLWSASLRKIGSCFGETEKDLKDQSEAGTLTSIVCEITPPKPEDANTYNMLKAQGKTQEELEKAGFPFKPSDRRDFKKA